jgi:hypothetical protein
MLAIMSEIVLRNQGGLEIPGKTSAFTAGELSGICAKAVRDVAIVSEMFNPLLEAAYKNRENISPVVLQQTILKCQLQIASTQS